MEIEIKTSDGKTAKVRVPDAWGTFAPAFKVLAIHENGREHTKGRPFAVIAVRELPFWD